jgi:glycerophosphoryl diester phosphodiesterase
MYRQPGAATVTLTALSALAAPVVLPVLPAAASPSGTDSIAHRGASAYAPENTIAACAVARDQRADACEFDLQQTKDHQLILMHDPTLARTTDVEKVFPGRAPWRVGDFTLAEIRRLDAGSWFSRRYRGEGVPTLAQALQAMSGSGLGMLLEIKHSGLDAGVEMRVAAELQDGRAWWKPRKMAVQAFDWQSVRVFHRLMPGVPVGVLGKPPAARLPEVAAYASRITLPHAGLTARYVEQAHRQGLVVATWPVKRPSVMRKMISYGVDGIMTNRPDSLNDTKKRR